MFNMAKRQQQLAERQAAEEAALKKKHEQENKRMECHEKMMANMCIAGEKIHAGLEKVLGGKFLGANHAFKLTLIGNDYGNEGWFMAAHRFYSHDKRDDKSTYAMATSKSFGDCWSIVPNEKGQYWLVFGQKGKEQNDWILTLAPTPNKPTDNRGDKSSYVVLHKKGMLLTPTAWDIKVNDNGSLTFTVADGPSKGFLLSCHRYNDTDKRDATSTRLCVHKPGWGCIQWKVHREY